MPEPSCATRKLATLTFVLRGHLPNITLCTTRNSYSCYTVKVPRRRPDPLRLFSHLSRNSAPGVCGKPQLKRRRTAMPIRNGRVSAPPLAGAREEANDQAGRRSPRQGRADGGYFVTTRRDAPPALCNTHSGTTSGSQGSPDRIRELVADRIPHAVHSQQRLPG